MNLRNLNEFLCSCVTVAEVTNRGLLTTIVTGARQVMNPPTFTKKELFDWAYNSHLVGADKEAAIKLYEAAK